MRHAITDIPPAPAKPAPPKTTAPEDDDDDDTTSAIVLMEYDSEDDYGPIVDVVVPLPRVLLSEIDTYVQRRRREGAKTCTRVTALRAMLARGLRVSR